jgi:hypothetical protein
MPIGINGGSRRKRRMKFMELLRIHVDDRIVDILDSITAIWMRVEERPEA